MTDPTMPQMLEGELGERALTDVLLQLSSHEATGILTIQGETDILAISFFQGRIVSTDSLNRTLEEGLGEVLENEGWVDAESYASLASEYRSGGGRVIDLLVERDYLAEERLGTALRQHIYSLGLDAFRWQDGEFKFYAGDEVSYEPCVRPISIEEFVVRASRDLGSSGPLEGAVADRKTPFRWTPDLPPPEDLNTLTAVERWLIQELQAPASVGQLIDRGPHDEFEVLFYLGRLERRGMLQRGQEVAGEPAVGPAPGASAPTTLSVETLAPAEEVGLGSPGGSPGDSPGGSPGGNFPLAGASPPVVDLTGARGSDPYREAREGGREADSSPEVISLGPVGDVSGQVPMPTPAPGAGIGFGTPAESIPPPLDVEMPDPRPSADIAQWGVEKSPSRLPKVDLGRVVPWVARSIAGFGALLLIGGLFYGADRTVLPFPWQSGQRADLARHREAARVARLDEALRVHFLLEGSFPESLEQLLLEGWVREGDLADAQGRRFAYSPTTSTFVLQSELVRDDATGGLLHRAGITGNFLLDPDLAAYTDPAIAPLVLLD